MIDEIRKSIQERLDDLMVEVEKLRRAHAELDPRERTPARRAGRSKSAPASRAAPKAAPAKASRARPATARTRTESAPAAPGRTPPGATKAKVLGALSSDGALTAGEVATATGLGRATVSTTLSKLARSGEVAKAERGYRLPG